jgi:flavin reductase (DIM6/NTAB) family NADH-FMN oxidoreductase RutF
VVSLLGFTPVMPPHKQKMGFARVSDKFALAELHPIASELVKAPRVLECAVQLEAKVQSIQSFNQGSAASIEVEIVRTYVDDSLLSSEKRHQIDPDKWQPLIMSFLEFYGLSKNLHHSKLADVF